VTPTESREVVLGLSRERLARATSRFERTARDAAERINQLKQEKLALERRLHDLETLFAQERQNFEQRASVLASVASESEERAKAFTDANARLADQEQVMNEQLATITRLESELANRASQLRDQKEMELAWQAELEEWKTTATQLEVRVQKISAEREAFRTKIMEDERMNAQYVLKLTPEDREHAANAIDTLLDQFAALESKVMATEET
jgi:chromosome segregation ATPase